MTKFKFELRDGPFKDAVLDAIKRYNELPDWLKDEEDKKK